MFKKYRIALHGCDDSTYIEWDLKPEEYELLKCLEASFKKESAYQCQPIMEIEELEPK